MARMRRKLVNRELHCLLTFPKGKDRVFKARFIELKMLGVKEVYSYGNIKVCGIHVVGKGTNSLVVLSNARSFGVTALKILRVDSPRLTLIREAAMIQMLNKIGLKPKLFTFSSNFIVREYIEGETLDSWIKHATSKELVEVFCKILDILYKLDAIHLFHGELARPGKHVLVTKTLEPVIIDFESGSLSSKKSNITQFAQAIFFRNILSPRVSQKKKDLTKRAINILKNYKKNRKQRYVDELKSLIITLVEKSNLEEKYI